METNLNQTATMNSIENSNNLFLKNMIGTITRTFFMNCPAGSEEQWKFMTAVYEKNPGYFSNNEKRRSGEECWPYQADTMIGVYRMVNIHTCLQDVIDNKVEGDFVETGVWKGGACVFANAVIHEAKEENNRRVHVFDSFEGLPKPYMSQDAGDIHHTIECLAVSLEQVKEVFSSYNLLTPNVVFRKGWFKDTMQETSDIKNIAVLRLDGDMYSSTMEVLTALYDKVSVGGFIIVDDWTILQAQRAVKDFWANRKLDVTITMIDRSSCYWKKQ